ncbi:hypothetical protein [Mucilaginibacter sp. 10B2]|uniref:hypothetical protein n=1 Tax=Mucilaginibacter sp. 10B2 TaxID=3048574 RepID=UPI002B23BDBE|nr:hypothetical protein [Mucilaginibacter sp. 10B2]MEB0280707.1 hypothetical protein [Mucilaginibacter sp. 10B2]
MKISELIELSSAFSAEVNVQRDFEYKLNGRNEYLDGYLPNLSSRYIMRQVFESLSFRDSRKVHLITASYGTGKSYLLLIMAYLLGNFDPDLFSELKKKIEDKEDVYKDGLTTILQEYWKTNSEYLIVIPSYGTEDFNQAMLAALNNALGEKNLPYRPKTHYLRAAEALEGWKHNNHVLYAKFESKISGKSGSDFIDLLKKCDGSAYETFKKNFQEVVGSEFSEVHGDIYQAFADTAQHIMSSGYKGIVILHDEFGGVLDKLINKTSQTASLKIQEFLENVKNKISNSNIIFIAASHQNPSTILEDKLKNIEKINGRFERHQLVIEDAESEELMGKVFLTKNTVAKNDLITSEITEELLDQTGKLALYDGRANDWIINKIIKGLYPLHPLTSFILPQLSNQFAQNTRSMFNFLSPKEIRQGGLKNYLEQTATLDASKKLNLYTPDMLLTFFEDNLADGRSENVAALVDAYRTSLGRRDDAIIKRVMENILVLTATRKQQILPTFDVLLWAMDNVNINDLRELMDSLVNDEILELNQKGVYEFPTFGSRNLSKIIQEEKSKIGTLTLSNSKIIWAEVRGPEAFTFDEHNDKYGSNRSFRTLWINNPDELDAHLDVLQKSYRWENKDFQIQGYVIYLLIKDENDLEAYQIKINQYTDVLKYIVFAYAKSPAIFSKIADTTFDFLAWNRAGKNTEVTGNPNHLQRVKAELNRLHSELTSQIRNLFEPINWLWSFSKLEIGTEIKSPRALENGMDEFVNELFTNVPKVKDEDLWFTKYKPDTKAALSEILIAEKNRVPLINLNNKAQTTRIISNFFNHLKITSEIVTLNKVHYGEIKVPDPGSPAEAIFKLIDKTLKVDQMIPPAAFIKPLLQEPFGLSVTLIKFIFTSFLRANRENLLIIDPKRPAYALDKDPDTVEDLFKYGSTLTIRKLEMSSFEIKYLKQLNGLFSKDSNANDFGELSKRFDGLINFFNPLHWELMKQKEDIEKFYKEFLQPFLQNATLPGVDREKAAREFFMITLPGFFLSIGSKEEFENDTDNISKLIFKLKNYKEYPHIEESAFKQQVVSALSNKVFKTSIATIDDFREVVKLWFNNLSYTIKSLAVFEDQAIMTWLKKLRSSEPIDVAKFYLEELATPPIKDWNNLAYQTHEYVSTIEKYKTQIEIYTRSPLAVYQSIARSCFSMSANDCVTEQIFKETFETWWNKLPQLSKSPHFENALINTFVEEYQTDLPTKDKFLKYIPLKWIQAGLQGVINKEWEEWSPVEIGVIADQYAKCVTALYSWKPPISEEAFCKEISQVFRLGELVNFEELQLAISNIWFGALTENTRCANWPDNSLEGDLLTAIQKKEVREFLLNVLPSGFGLREFKYWDDEALQRYIINLTELKSVIEDYKRPIMDVVKDLGKKLKIKADSVSEFRVQLKENVRAMEAFSSNADLETGLLTDMRAIPFLNLIRKLNSDGEFYNLVEVIGIEFHINQSYYLWNADLQRQFVKEMHEVYTYLQKWKYPHDTRMDDARLKINTEIEAIQQLHELSKSQIIKILQDVLADQSK